MVQQLALFDDQTNPFERIKHFDENGNEIWFARELMPTLDYSKWENFHKAIRRAITSLKSSGGRIEEHFLEIRKPYVSGNGTKQDMLDYKLSRYACYLIANNGDVSKQVIADAQAYFLTQARRQELADQRQKKQIPFSQSKDYLHARHSGYDPEQAEQTVKFREKLKQQQNIVNEVRQQHGAHNGDFARLNAVDSEVATGKTPGEWKEEYGTTKTPSDYHSPLNRAMLYFVKHRAAKVHDQNNSHGVDDLENDVRSIQDQVDSTRDSLSQLLGDEPLQLPAPKAKQTKLLKDGN